MNDSLNRHLSPASWVRPSPSADPKALLRALRQCRHSRNITEAALAQTQQALRAAQRALALSRLRERRAQFTADRDALTGLPNRLAFGRYSADALAWHAAHGQGFCLLFLDLDNFKAVNDGLGHAAGDSLLRVVSARLVHAMRGEDRVSRHGGDEFICLLPKLQRDDHALAISHKLIDIVSAPYQLGLASVQVRASIGIAMFPRDGQTVASLVDRADHAMLHAKTEPAGITLASQLPPASEPVLPDSRKTFLEARHHAAIEPALQGNLR